MKSAGAIEAATSSPGRLKGGNVKSEVKREANVIAGAGVQPRLTWQNILMAASLAGVLFLALYNLTSYPLPWYDEGSHLHVPKTLVRFGVYADYSSEGFRYYGPTVGIGPTVFLPIAAMFKLFGVGLFQARLVMALFLLAAIAAFYRLAGVMGAQKFAWVATALLVATRAVGLLEYGRQVLGEVPGLFFMAAGFAVWFGVWEKASWRQLTLAGLLLGLALVTKNQYLLVLAPTLLFAWAANLYYRSAPQRVFLVPGSIAAACFALWQAYTIIYLGPATAGENLASWRAATASVVVLFDPSLMSRALGELLGMKAFLGLLLPALIYSVTLILPRRRDGHQWGILCALVAVNFVWYVVASISWTRYAFPGLAVSCLFVARFFHDLTDGYHFDWPALKTAWQKRQFPQADSLRWVLLAWLTAAILIPLGLIAKDIVRPPFNAPQAMAAYLDENVPKDQLIETWEPELGFLTDHNYHYPPQLLLYTAVKYIWLEDAQTAPSDEYHFVETERPPYVIISTFGRFVEVYPYQIMEANYDLVTTIGEYELYELKK
ncbi:MAG: glycosyltransferase family 39 protein [Chloroflexi bacterium]|nr:glycosyltransferase family 39 protein [Chloroflexota bacterium]